MTYIVVSPAYNPNSGGTIFLHGLVQALHDMGEEAMLWPMAPIYSDGVRGRMKRALRRAPTYETAPGLEQAVARQADLKRPHVVVYPELVRGNPLGSENVVRWLLYKPGLRHPYEFGDNDMFFRVDSMSDLPELTGGAPDLSLWKVNPVYRNENRPDRDGVCYMVRKGEGKDRIPETEVPGAICLDGLSHEEINDAFNRCHTFYSYDEATMYSQYAAVCGCLSVVIPGLYPSRAEWSAEHELARYGVAYGLDDLDHARATRDKVAGLLRAEEEKGRETVRNFITLTRERFG